MIFMALINCPECNKEISDKAKSCPHCGYNLPKQKPIIQGVYCPSCLKSGIKTSIDTCPFCHIKFKDSIYGTVEEVYNYGENHPELRQSPEFNEEAYQRRINYVPEDYSSSGVKCPVCKSANISKIDTLNRIASVGLFGLASSKIGKTHKCNNCGTTW